MSLRRNIVGSFASQVYVALVGILALPLYVSYMGAEAFGLVAFFAMLQVWFNLLDMGLTATLARETARQRGNSMDALSFRRLVRALEALFLVVAVLACASLLYASDYIASDWLRAHQLPAGEVLAAVQLMAPIIALRWMAGLYRGAISGAERLVWLGAFNAVIASLRFVGVLPLLMFVGAAPALFFGYQLAVAVIELALLVLYTYRLLPALPAGTRVPWQWSPLKPVLKFSLSMALASSAWVMVTQTDKLVLSRVLPLADYGYFSLAVLVASGIMVLSGPVGSAIMPRLSMLEAEGRHATMIQVYRHATQLVTAVAGTAAITLALNAEELLHVWTGDAQLAHTAAPILALYALGNGILAVAAFPYYLQFAKGNLRLHLIGNAVFVVVLIPLVVWAATHYGAVGAGYVWLGTNLLLFVAWLPVVHWKFSPGLNLRWYFNDIGSIFAAIAVAAVFTRLLLPPTGTGPMLLLHIALAAALGLAAAAAASSAARARLRSFWREHTLRHT